jgi:hypothetical protein
VDLGAESCGIPRRIEATPRLLRSVCPATSTPHARTADKANMDILSPKTAAALRVLILGAAPSDLEALTRLFADADLCVDLVCTREDALACFVEHGGHDAVFVIGAETEEIRTTLLQLCEVDPHLALGQSAGLPSRNDILELEGDIARR